MQMERLQVQNSRQRHLIDFQRLIFGNINGSRTKILIWDWDFQYKDSSEKFAICFCSPCSISSNQYLPQGNVVQTVRKILDPLFDPFIHKTLFRCKFNALNNFKKYKNVYLQIKSKDFCQGLLFLKKWCKFRTTPESMITTHHIETSQLICSILAKKLSHMSDRVLDTLLKIATCKYLSQWVPIAPFKLHLQFPVIWLQER